MSRNKVAELKETLAHNSRLHADICAKDRRIEQLEAALKTLCFHWDQMLNNLDDGEEFEAREAARAALE